MNRFFFSLLLCGLVACPENDSGDASPGGSSADGGSALVAAPRSTCSYDDECSAQEICAADGYCREAVDCQEDYHCNPCDQATCGFGGKGYCVEGFCKRARPLCAPCQSDAQCGEDSATGLSNRCGNFGGDRVCLLEAGRRACPRGQLRSDDGFCVPGDRDQCGGILHCGEASECPDGKTCSRRDEDPGLCLDLCGGDDDCVTGQICGPDGLCVRGCAERGCPTNQVCHDTGRCGSACSQQEDCSTGYECRQGRCRLPGCGDDNDCPPVFGVYCDPDTRQCLEGCRTDDHCSATQVCRETACVDRPCRTKELDCELGQFCCGVGLFGEGGETCPEGVEVGACFEPTTPFCQTCDNNDDCPAPRFEQDSLCVEYQDPEGNSRGKSCALGCRDLSDCPRGFECSAFEDQDGNPAGQVCTNARCAGD